MSKKIDWAYGLRTVDKDGRAYGGFVWPKKGKVTAPDWRPTAECGNGLHALLNGEGDSNLLSWEPDALWQVVRFDATTMVELGGKVKFPCCDVIHTGTRATATQRLAALVGGGHAIHGLVLHSDGKLIANGGNYSTLTGGGCSTLTGGDGSMLTGGDGSRLTGGYRSHLTGGYRSHLTGGYRSHLTGGDCSTLTGGNYSTLTGGDGSCITIVWWCDGKRRSASFNQGEDYEADVLYKAICEGRSCGLEKVAK